MTGASDQAQRVLVVVSHPRKDSLTWATAERVLQGLEHAGAEVRELNLDDEDFEPRLSCSEKRNYGTSRPSELGHHFESLLWADRLVLVYPTWFSSQPARLKGWFDRVWLPGVAFDPPEKPTGRIKGRLTNLRSIDVVTTHGSNRWVNMVQNQAGLRFVRRSLRQLCHPLCRVRVTALYNVDRLTEAEAESWLNQVESRFGS